MILKQILIRKPFKVDRGDVELTMVGIVAVQRENIVNNFNNFIIVKQTFRESEYTYHRDKVI